ncbi:MAG: PAS domain-containing sensor histidine kinase [Chlorobi bacterium]|nr:PAS domain-containing sensor histidine kinase [Chlorobiota bacterium]
MNLLVVTIACMLASGCGEQRDGAYPFRLAVLDTAATGGLVWPVITSNGSVVGFQRGKNAIIERHQGKHILHVTIGDSLIDMMPIEQGYAFAYRDGDSVRIAMYLHKQHAVRLLIATRHSGRFLPSMDGSKVVWLGGGELYVIEDSSTCRVNVGTFRSSARSVLDDTVLVILDRLAEHLMLWEGTNVVTGRKLFSTFVVGRSEFSAATAERICILVRSGPGYALEWYKRSPRGDAIIECTVTLPLAYYEPQAVATIGDTVLAFFRSGIIVATTGGVLAEYRYALRSLPNEIGAVVRDGEDVVVVGPDAAVRLRLARNPLWWFDQNISNVVRIAIASIVGLIVLFIIRRIGRYRRLVGALLDRGGGGALLLVDRRKRLLRLNTAARELFGIPRSAPLKLQVDTYLHDQCWGAVHTVLEQTISHQRPLVQELSVKTGDVERHFLVSTEPLYGTFNRFEGVLVSILDVTPQYQHWQLLNWAQIAHDLQTSLTTVRMNAEQLAGYLLPAQEHQRQRIVQLTTLLLERFRDFLVIVRDDRMNWEPCALEGLFHEAVAEVSAGAQAQISFLVRPTPLVIELDRRRFVRALHNALTNAIRAFDNEGGSIELWADLFGEAIRICVRDNGRGMDQETLARFMQPLFTTNRLGHGFGSMIMRQMVELHGGRIEVESVPGHGTTVIFYLPRRLHVRH